MHFSYSLVEDDLISLAEFQFKQSGRLRKRAHSRRILYPLGFGLLALGIRLTSDDLVLPLVFGLSALISFFVVPTLYPWLSRRRLPHIVRSKISSTSIDDRTVSATEKGLQQKVGELYSEVSWSIVHDIIETPSHIFIAIDGVYSLVIPKKVVDGDELQRFVELLRKKIQKADA